MTSFERVAQELGTWVERSVLRLALLVVLVALLGARAAVAAETITLQIPSTTVTLPNGLTVVVSPKHKLPMVVDQRPREGGIGQRPGG